jgi:hypothetical protein
MTTLFGADEMAAYQEEFADLACDKAATLTRGNTTTQTVVQLVAPSAGTIAEYATRLGSLQTIQANLPYGTDVLETDRLTVDGREYLVQVVLKESFPVFTRALVAEVQ